MDDYRLFSEFPKLKIFNFAFFFHLSLPWLLVPAFRKLHNFFSNDWFLSSDFLFAAD